MKNSNKTTTSIEKTVDDEKKPQRIFVSEQIIRFKERLKFIIGDRSVRSFSRDCGLAEKTLRNYMAGKQYPTLDRLDLIANASGKTIEWLVTGQDSSDIKKEGSTERRENADQESIPIDRELLQTSIEAIELLCEKKRLRMSPEKKAKVIALVYTISLEEKNVDESVIYQILDLAS
ncbi:TPA: hypothetical protein KDX89_004570 [Vibrio parahaemolyticus]|nr:hypothetical protein [Vibrio parahaemolyticus]